MGKNCTTKSDGNVLRFAHYLASKGRNCSAHFDGIGFNRSIFDKDQGWIEVMLDSYPYVIDIDENNNEMKRTIYIEIQFDWSNMGWITVGCKGILPFDHSKGMPIFKNLDEDLFPDKLNGINPRYRIFYTGILEHGYMIDEIVIDDYKKDSVLEEVFESIYKSIVKMETAILKEFADYLHFID